MQARTLTVFLFITIASVARAQTPADGWSGELKCVLTASAPSAGYQDDQTHTWVLTGPPAARADFRDYPATWTVTGSGSRTPPPPAGGAPGPSDTWTRRGSDSTGSITLFVPKGTNALRIAPGQKPLKAVGGISATLGSLRAAAAASASGDVDEWRFPYIDVADAAKQTTLKGTRTQTQTALVGWRQPTGASVTETCSWSLAKGAKPTLTSTATSQSAAVASTSVNVVPAGAAGGIQQIEPGGQPAGSQPPGSQIDKSQRGREAAFVDLNSKLSIDWSDPATVPLTPGAARPLVSGGTAALSLTVANPGAAAVDGARVKLPAVTGVTPQSITCSLPKCPSVAQLQQGWAIPQLAASGTARFTTKVSIAAPSGTLALTADVTPPKDKIDTNPADNTAALSAQVIARASDLQLTIAPPLSKPTWTRFSYDVTVKNFGQVAVTDATVTIPLVAGYQKLSVSASCVRPPGGGFSNVVPATCPTNPTVAQIEQAIPIPVLPAGSSATLTIAAVATASGTATLSASAAMPAGYTDTSPGNNSATAPVVTVAAPPPGDTDVAVDLPTDLSLRHFTSFDYDVRVRNLGQAAAADGAIVTIPAVAGLRKLSVSCGLELSGGARAINQGEPAACPVYPTVAQVEQGIAIPRLPSGASVTFTIGALATSTGSVTLPASISLAAGFTDPVASNNSASNSVSLTGIEPPGNADVRTTVTVTNIGSVQLRFSVKVSNFGPDAANFAVVRIPAVAGMTPVQVFCQPPQTGAGALALSTEPCPPNLTMAGLAAGLEIPRLRAQSSLTFEIDLRSETPPTTATLSASVTPPSGGTDPNPANNSASATGSVN